jgi:hypothetical protein
MVTDLGGQAFMEHYSVVLIPARMPVRSGRHMAALVPLKGLGCLEAVEGDCLCPVHRRFISETFELVESKSCRLAEVNGSHP